MLSFKIDTLFGSQQSLDWTDALMDAPSHIFDSQARRIVEFKWDNAQFYVILDASLNLILTVLILVDIWYFYACTSIKVAIMVYAALLLIKVLVRMYLFATFKNRRECSYHIEYENNNRLKNNLRQFLMNPFNMFDIIGHVLIIIHCIAFLVQEKPRWTEDEIMEREKSLENYNLNLIHLIAIISILTRGCLSSFRLFNETRYLVGMILEVFHDINGFLFILLSAVLVFSVIFMFLERQMFEQQFFINGEIIESLHMSYSILFANFPFGFETRTITGWLVYVASTMFLIVIMLNLLISIISDTYDRI